MRFCQSASLIKYLSLETQWPSQGLINFYWGTDRTVKSCCNFQKLTITSQFSDNFQLFLAFCFSCQVTLLVLVSSQYHHIITGSGVMAIFLYRGLTRNPEIGNISVWLFPNIWRLGQVRDTKFGTNVSNKMLLNASKCQNYSFYLF